MLFSIEIRNENTWIKTDYGCITLEHDHEK